MCSAEEPGVTGQSDISQISGSAHYRHGVRQPPVLATATTTGYCQGGLAHEEGGSYQELETEVGATRLHCRGQNINSRSNFQIFCSQVRRAAAGLQKQTSEQLRSLQQLHSPRLSDNDLGVSQALWLRSPRALHGDSGGEDLPH